MQRKKVMYKILITCLVCFILSGCQKKPEPVHNEPKRGIAIESAKKIISGVWTRSSNMKYEERYDNENFSWGVEQIDYQNDLCIDLLSVPPNIFYGYDHGRDYYTISNIVDRLDGDSTIEVSIDLFGNSPMQNKLIIKLYLLDPPGILLSEKIDNEKFSWPQEFSLSYYRKAGPKYDE